MAAVSSGTPATLALRGSYPSASAPLPERPNSCMAEDKEGAGQQNQMPIPGFFQGTGMPDPGWWEALWPNPGKVLMEVGLSAGMSAVDLCCGDGWFTLPMGRIARHITAIDIDPALLKIARDRIAKARISNCTLIQADAFAIRQAIPQPVDYVFLANVFHGVPDRSRLARVV